MSGRQRRSLAAIPVGVALVAVETRTPARCFANSLSRPITNIPSTIGGLAASRGKGACRREHRESSRPLLNRARYGLTAPENLLPVGPQPPHPSGGPDGFWSSLTRGWGRRGPAATCSRLPGSLYLSRSMPSRITGLGHSKGNHAPADVGPWSTLPWRFPP